MSNPSPEPPIIVSAADSSRGRDPPLQAKNTILCNRYENQDDCEGNEDEECEWKDFPNMKEKSKGKRPNADGMCKPVSKKSKTDETECHSLANLAIVITVSVSDPRNIERDIGKAIDNLDDIDVLCSDSEILTRRALVAERRTQTTSNVTVTIFVTTPDPSGVDPSEVENAVITIDTVQSTDGITITEINQSSGGRRRRTRSSLDNGRRLARRRVFSPNTAKAMQIQDSFPTAISSTGEAPIPIAVATDQIKPVGGPCSSAESLTNFLDHQDAVWNTFSKSNPVCESAANNHIHVMIPFYNLSPDVVKGAVASALGQDYPGDRLTVWLYDDASDDPSTITSVCASTIVVNDFHPPSNNDNSWDNMQQNVETMGIEDKQSGLLCIRSSRHLGPGE